MRGITISRLRQIADYMESVCRRTGIARVVGSGGGILAGSLTVAGGVLTVLTAGAAAPVLVGTRYPALLTVLRIRIRWIHMFLDLRILIWIH